MEHVVLMQMVCDVQLLKQSILVWKGGLPSVVPETDVAYEDLLNYCPL